MSREKKPRKQTAKPAKKTSKQDKRKSEAVTDSTKGLQNLRPWQPGQSGNPAGRPKGSRNKLGEAFIQDMYDAWQASGPQVLANVIKDEPAAFLRSMVAILPKEVDVNVNRYDAMTDEQLKTQFLAALREARALGIDLGTGEPANLH